MNTINYNDIVYLFDAVAFIDGHAVATFDKICRQYDALTRAQSLALVAGYINNDN